MAAVTLFSGLFLTFEVFDFHGLKSYNYISLEHLNLFLRDA